MTDYSKLKELAEMATPGPWKAQHPNAGQRGSEVAGADGLNQVCADLGPTNSLYIAAANPAVVLALIAENEALRLGMKGDYDLDAWLEWTREAETLRKDAERYRWLRNKQHTMRAEFMVLDIDSGNCIDDMDWLHLEALDSAVDAAISNGQAVE